ncbi:MAG: fasciclin domain-containing protein [Endomicrobiales bacterium]
MKTAVKRGNIIETAEKDGSFTIFAEAARESGLGEILSGKAGLTVFAPVDEAFEKLSEEERKKIFGSKERLTEILTYHIVPGRLSVSQLMDLSSARTLQGGKLSLDSCAGFTVNNARIVKGDIDCGNGIIHGIDTLLLPEEALR